MSDGIGCKCYAYSESECACDGVDWTPKELIDARQRIAELEAENTTLLDLHSKAMKSLTSQVLKRRELEAANAKMRKCLEAIAEHHDELSIYPTMPEGEPAQDQYHTERRDFAREAMK